MRERGRTHETPPSSRAEGLLFLPGLESNPESSLQTEDEEEEIQLADRNRKEKRKREEEGAAERR